MKQIIRLYTLLVASCLLTGCNSDEDVGGNSTPVAVQFGSGIVQTKTANDGNQWTLNDRIGIFMIKNGQPLNSSYITEDADNVEYKAQTGGNAISGFTPVSGTPIFYPQNGDKVDFIAYYPYKSSLTNYIYPVDVSNQTSPANIDVLYANTANIIHSGYNKNSGTVDLGFNHVLSKLSFTLISGTGSPSLAGAKIEITNLATTADMSLADGTVTATNSGQTLIANTATEGLSSSAIVIPQTLSGTKLIVTLADNASKFEWDFPANTELQIGKNHQYTITVSKTGITVSSSGITIWTGTGDLATPGTAGTLTQYKVGDYYPDPTNPGTAIGVVFWLDPTAWGYNSSGTPTGYFGKIVSLDQQNGVPWGDNNIDEQAAGVEGIRNSSDGSQGTFNLISKRKDQSNFSTAYRAFNWIYQKNANDVNGIWYMPAIDELKTLYNIQGTINPKITSAGGTAVYFFYYLSSTEYASNGAYVIDLEDGTVYSSPNAMNKSSSTSTIYVRGIAKF